MQKGTQLGQHQLNVEAPGYKTARALMWLGTDSAEKSVHNNNNINNNINSVDTVFSSLLLYITFLTSYGSPSFCYLSTTRSGVIVM